MKTIPFTAAHTYIAHIWQYPPPPGYDHATPLLIQLHWLPVKPVSHLCDKHNTSEISISISTRKKEHVPFFLCLCLFHLCYANRTSVNQALVSALFLRLRSSSRGLLKVPRSNTKYGDRSFSVCAPTLWNSLPDHLRLTTDPCSFKRDLKTYLFCESFY